MTESSETKEFINVEKILMTKAPRLYKRLPRFVINYLIRIFHQDEINSDLQKISDEVGVPKFHKQLEISNIKINYHGKELVPPEGRFIFASNHPMGGPEGIMIVSAVGRMFPKTKLMVNDLLMNLPDIEDVFIPINRFGRNKHDYVDILDCSFLDLFSGSGGIGIEALSRGAKKAYFVDNSPSSINCIMENLLFTKMADKAVVLKQDVLASLFQIFEKDVDIIFMDPPYDTEIEKQVLYQLKSMKYVSPHTLIVVEASLNTDFSYLDSYGYELVKEKVYKTNKHVFLQLKED